MTRPKVVSLPDLRGAHAQAAQGGLGRGKDRRAGTGLDRHGLAGDGGLVDGRLAGDHLAVDRDRLTRTHDDDLAGLHLGNRHLNLAPVPLHPGRLRRQGHQVLDRAPARSVVKCSA